MRFLANYEPSTWAIRRALRQCCAYIIGDGFDLYTFVNDGSTTVNNGNQWEGNWNGLNNTNAEDFTRFGYGRALHTVHVSGNGGKTFGANYSTLFWTLAHYQGVALTTNHTSWSLTCKYYDGTTVQCAIGFTESGRIRLFRGDFATLQAEWTTAFVPTMYDHYQIKVVIHATAGEIHIRKNGATSDMFSATGLNTQVTANAYATKVWHQESFNSNYFSFVYMDDCLHFSGSGDAPNDWVGDIRAIQLQPTLDTAQKDFAALATGTSLALGTTANAGTKSITAGQLETGARISTTQGGTFTTATVEFSAGFTGNAKLAFYMADGDTQGFNSQAAPGHLVATSNAVVNPVTGANTFTFPGTVSYMKGYVYQFVLLTDTNCTMKADSATAPTYRYIVPGGYSSGFPADLAAITIPQTTTQMTIYTTLTATNAGHVNDRATDGLTTYVYDNTVGHYDLYDLIDLFYTPSSVVGVTLRAQVQKTDAGGRGFKIAAKSGATAFETSEFLPATAFGSWGQFYKDDPNTGSPWAASALNALQIGPKVSS